MPYLDILMIMCEDALGCNYFAKRIEATRFGWCQGEEKFNLLILYCFFREQCIFMVTLPNMNTRRGGKEPSHAGFASSVSPEVQSPQAEDSHTGVTSDFVSSGKCQWFVFRALYGHTNDVVKALEDKGVRVYIPMRYDRIKISGKERIRKVPFLPGLVFAYITREMTHMFVKQPAPTSRYMKYYTDKTLPVEAGTGFNPPVIVRDSIMEEFIKASSIESDHSMMLPRERCRFKKDELVRVIKGDFKGVVGKVTRAAGQQRVGIDIEGLGTFVTAYIPSDFMEKIE